MARTLPSSVPSASAGAGSRVCLLWSEREQFPIFSVTGVNVAVVRSCSCSSSCSSSAQVAFAVAISFLRNQPPSSRSTFLIRVTVEADVEAFEVPPILLHRGTDVAQKRIVGCEYRLVGPRLKCDVGWTKGSAVCSRWSADGGEGCCRSGCS